MKSAWILGVLVCLSGCASMNEAQRRWGFQPATATGHPEAWVCTDKHSELGATTVSIMLESKFTLTQQGRKIDSSDAFIIGTFERVSESLGDLLTLQAVTMVVNLIVIPETEQKFRLIGHVQEARNGVPITRVDRVGNKYIFTDVGGYSAGPPQDRTIMSYVQDSLDSLSKRYPCN